MHRYKHSLPVSQLLHDLTNFILQRPVDISPIVPVSCDKFLDQSLQGLWFELLVVGDFDSFFVRT